MQRRIVVSFVVWSLCGTAGAAPGSLEPPAVPAAPGTAPLELGVPHSDEVDLELAKAAQAFDAGRFDAAIAAFEAAYALDPDPSFLYNIGRVYEELGQLEPAIEHYGRFATHPGVNLELRRRALERMQVLSAIVSATADEAEPPTRAEPPPPVVGPRPVVDARDRVELAPRPNGRALQASGLTLLGVGLGTMIAGAVFAGLAGRDDDRLAQTDEPSRRIELVRRGERRAALADGLLIGGAVVAVVGVVLGTVGLVRSRRARTLVDGRRVVVRF